MNTGPELIRSTGPRDRNWLPLAIAALIVIVAAVGVVAVLERGRSAATVAPVSAVSDPYAANLPITGVAMSEAANLAGGKVTYLDGHISNKGNKTVSGIAVQVLFRNVANEVAQNEKQPMQWIRTREPYVDLEPVSAAPLKPGDERDFRLIFDTVTPDWDGAYPQLRILKAETR